MEKKSIGWGFGLLLAALSIFIMVLIGFSFFAAKPEYSITPAIIVLICLLLILALSNSFDNFSIGKLLTISKEAKENKDRAEKLEKEKEELIFKLVNVNFQSQKASSGIFLGDSIAEKLVVQKANSEEIKAEEKEEEKEGEKENSASDNTSKYRFLNRRKYRSLLIKRYFGVSKINLVEEDIKLESQYQDQNIDPISVQPMLFHAHLNDCNQEIFIRIVDVRFSTTMASHGYMVY